MNTSGEIETFTECYSKPFTADNKKHNNMKTRRRHVDDRFRPSGAYTVKRKVTSLYATVFGKNYFCGSVYYLDISIGHSFHTHLYEAEPSLKSEYNNKPIVQPALCSLRWSRYRTCYEMYYIT